MSDPTWIDTHVIGGASLGTVLFLVGTSAVWSASIWLIVDRVKDGIGLQKPYKKRVRFTLTFAPLVMSIAVCMFAFPLMLGGLELGGELDAAMLGNGAWLGVITWAGAKVAHDFLGDVLTALRDSVVARIRRFGDPAPPSSTSQPFEAVPDDHAEIGNEPTDDPLP